MRTITPRLLGSRAGNRHSSARVRAELVTEAVVASYIHNISARHRTAAPDRRTPRLLPLRAGSQA